MRRRAERQWVMESRTRGAVVLDGEGGLQGTFGFCFSCLERIDRRYVNEMDCLFA